MNLAVITAYNAVDNNTLYYKGKKIPGTDWITTDKVKDYDLNFGVKGDVVFTSIDIGTGGNSKNFNVIPNFGGGAYFSVTPKGELQLGSASVVLPYLPIFNMDVMMTKDGNYGFGITGGIFASPIKANIAVNVPTNRD